MTRSITILGATGSIGASALDLIERRDDLRVEAVTGASNIASLADIARRTRARLAVTADPGRLADLRDALAGSDIEVAAGPAAVADAASRPADWALNAIVGAAGLDPSLAVLERGGTLALANKETLVAAGPLVMATARRTGATILPVDSEHSGLAQCLRGERLPEVERMTLTASGGAFRDWPLARLAQATPEEAAQHPNWSMGRRITVDSASMFNKALELIEARELFDLDPGRIDALMHPESLVHALVTFRDGGTLAHLGAPDMRHAIGHALDWPDRRYLPVPRLDLAAAGTLTFHAPDPARYPALGLAREAMHRRGVAGAVLNAAKEAALDAFLDRRLPFTGMAEVVGRVLDRLGDAGGAAPDLAAVRAADAWARGSARSILPEFA